MPSRGRQAAEQRFAPLHLVEMEALRIEFHREGLDGVSGERERTEFAPLPYLDVFEEMHQEACHVAVSRRSKMIGETISHSTCPEELLATILNMTMPVVGRLRETRASVTSMSSIMSSPGRNGASQRNSLTPGEPNDAVRPIKPSNIIRMMIEQRCQPDPASPFSIERAAAASSRCIGCGSNSAAKARISSAVTCRGPKRPKGPGLKSSKTRVFMIGDILREARLWPHFAAISTHPRAWFAFDLPELAFGASPFMKETNRANHIRLVRGENRCSIFRICFSGIGLLRRPLSRHFTGL